MNLFTREPDLAAAEVHQRPAVVVGLERAMSSAVIGPSQTARTRLRTAPKVRRIPMSPSAPQAGRTR